MDIVVIIVLLAALVVFILILIWGLFGLVNKYAESRIEACNEEILGLFGEGFVLATHASLVTFRGALQIKPAGFHGPSAISPIAAYICFKRIKNGSMTEEQFAQKLMAIARKREAREAKKRTL